MTTLYDGMSGNIDTMEHLIIPMYVPKKNGKNIAKQSNQ